MDSTYATNLPMFNLLDLSVSGGNGTAVVNINYTTHNFAPIGGSLTGVNPDTHSVYKSSDMQTSMLTDVNFPIYGATSYYNVPAGSDPNTYVPSTTYSVDYGLGLFRIKRGVPFNIIFNNNTGFSYDMHWHGLNTAADNDGASGETEFGAATKRGSQLVINHPSVTNNSGFLWFHSHPMFYASSNVYSGIVGMLDVADDASAMIDNLFTYGDNNIIAFYGDLDMNQDGTINKGNLYTDTWRGTYGMINGISAVCWYSDSAPYVNKLYHISTKNLVKISLGNFTCSFREIYLGVCDGQGRKQKFYYVQSDDGYRNPILLDMISLSPANRGSIIVDLSTFDNKTAYLFFYDFDLTQVIGISVDPAGTFNDPSANLISQVQITEGNPNTEPPFLPSSSTINNNTTVSPLPIPTVVNGVNLNPEGNVSGSTWPPLPLNGLMPDGSRPFVSTPYGQLPPPTNYNIKKFMKLVWSPPVVRNQAPSVMNLNAVIDSIRQLVFGVNYATVKKLSLGNLNDGSFENIQLNYINYLNPNYYYNLPTITNVPMRKFALIPDPPDNCIGSLTDIVQGLGGNPFGGTELVLNGNRAYVDMWTNMELSTTTALKKYNANVNNYKPKNLPTCLFKINSSTSYDALNYTNYQMLANDKLFVDFFPPSVIPYAADGQGNTQYIENVTNPPVKPYASAVVTFPPTSVPLNITQWTKLVNETYAKTPVILTGTTTRLGYLSQFLSYDWTYFPFTVNYLQKADGSYNRPPITMNSVMVKNINKSTQYNLRITGKWELMNFFGKPMASMPAPLGSMSTMTMYPNAPAVPAFPNNYNMMIQELFTMFSDPLNPCNIGTGACGSIQVDMTDLVTLTIYAKDITTMSIPGLPANIISLAALQTSSVLTPAQMTAIYNDNNGIYKGFIDGYGNDNLMNFTSQLNGSEKWMYYNMDAQDTHPLHFHLTTGFAEPHDPYGSQALFDNVKNKYTQHTYSKDTYAIPSQTSITFYVKIANYTSYNARNIRNLGYMYHCHYLTHHDMMMMGQYYVTASMSDMFLC